MGTLYENIVVLCNERSIKPGRVCNDLGLSRGLMPVLHPQGLGNAAAISSGDGRYRNLASRSRLER